MKEQSEELNVLKQLFYNLSESQKKTFLVSIQVNTTTRKRITSSKPEKCPFCESVRFKKNGTVDGVQRYLCKDCKKTFGNTHNTILKSSKKDLAVWEKYVQCMIEKYSLRKCAQICGISLPTAFYWRHKILDALQKV